MTFAVSSDKNNDANLLITFRNSKHLPIPNWLFNRLELTEFDYVRAVYDKNPMKEDCL